MVTRIKKSFTAVPETLTTALWYLRAIGDKQREINRLKREAKKKIEEISEGMKKEVEILTRDRNNSFTAFYAFASLRKKELTKATRSQKTEAGVFGWRWTTPYVELAEGKTDSDIISTLKKKGLTTYIRVTEEIDREALLRDRPTVSGVSYVNRDEFFVKPKLSKEEGRAEELSKVTEAIDV